MIKKLFGKAPFVKSLCFSLPFLTSSVYSPSSEKWKKFLHERDNSMKRDAIETKSFFSGYKTFLDFQEEESLLSLITRYYPRPDLLREQSLFPQHDSLEDENIEEPFAPLMVRSEKNNINILPLRDEDISRMMKQKTLPKVFVVQHLFLRFLDLIWKNDDLMDNLTRCIYDPNTCRAYSYGFNNSTKYTLYIKKALQNAFTQEERDFFLSEVFQEKDPYRLEMNFCHFLTYGAEYNTKEFTVKKEFSFSYEKDFSHFISPPEALDFFQEKSKEDIKIVYLESENQNLEEEDEYILFYGKKSAQREIFHLLEAFFQDIFSHLDSRYFYDSHDYRPKKETQSVYQDILLILVSLMKNMSWDMHKSFKNHIKDHFRVEDGHLIHYLSFYKKCSFVDYVEGYKIVQKIRDTLKIFDILRLFCNREKRQENLGITFEQSQKISGLKRIFQSKLLMSIILEYTTDVAPYFLDIAKNFHGMQEDELKKTTKSTIFNEQFFNNFLQCFVPPKKKDYNIFFQQEDSKIQAIKEFILSERYHIFSSIYKKEFLEDYDYNHGYPKHTKEGFGDTKFHYEIYYTDKFIDELLYEFKDQILKFVLGDSWSNSGNIFKFFSKTKYYGIPSLFYKALIAYNTK